MNGEVFFETRKISYPDEPHWPRLQELKYEKDTVGFFVSGHPLDDFKYECQRYTTGTIGEYLAAASGREVPLTKVVTTIGKPGVAVAAITKSALPLTFGRT